MKRLMFAAVAAISLGVTAFAGTEPTCSGGDYVYSLVNGDKTDWVHVFSNGTASVSFTVPSNVKGTFDVQCLVVAGGGGGGAYKGGGGGAGRVTTGTLTLGANDSVQVTVGAGGAGGTRGTATVSAVNGGDSSVRTPDGSELRAFGGGHGGNYGESGAAGGCGGGGAVSKKDGGSGVGEPTSNGCKANATYGGGGGGAGGSPEAIGTSKGTGGPGVSSSISGAERVYGVGGFGSNAFDEHVDGGAGEDGTGNGGNALLLSNGTAGKGGDGIVILRYTEPETSGEAYAFGEVSDQVYTGAALEPAIVVTKGATALVQGTDYAVAYFDNVNAGAARAEIAGLGDHEGQLTGTVYFTIAPAANEWTVAPAVEPAAWLKSAEPGVFSASAKFGTVVISYEGADTPSSQVGTHTATFSVSASANYAGLPATEVTYTVVIHDGEPDTEAVTYTWNNPEGGDWIAPANWSASLEHAFGFPYSGTYATAVFGPMEGVEALTVRATDALETKALRFASSPAVTLDLGGNAYDATAVYAQLSGMVTVSNGTLTAGKTADGVNFSGEGLTVDAGGQVDIRTVNIGGNGSQLVSRAGGSLTVQRFSSTAGSSGLTVRAEGEGSALTFACQNPADFNSTEWTIEARNGGKVSLGKGDFTRGEREGAFVAADGEIVFVGTDALTAFATNVTDAACTGAKIRISGSDGAIYTDHGMGLVFGSNAEEAQALTQPPALEFAIPAEGFAAVPLETKIYKGAKPDIVIGSNVVVRLDVTDAAKKGEVCLMRAAGEINVDLARLTARTKGRGVDFAYELRTTEAEAQELWLSYRKTSGLVLFVR